MDESVRAERYPTNPQSWTKKVRFALLTQWFYSVMVLLVICQFLYCPAWRVYVPDQLVAGVYTITAWDVSLSKLIRVDKLRVNLMADFNTRKGIGKKTALLPLRFYQPLLDGQSKGYTVDPAEFENAMNILLHFGLLGY